MAAVDDARSIAIVVPAYQAVRTVAAVVSGVRRAVPDARVYVVDDGSTDGTGAAAATAGATVIAHAQNQGKGAALATGIGRAAAEGGVYLVTLDADGQHAPDLLPRLLEPLHRGDADLVLGARPRGGGMPLSRRATNWLSATVASRIAGTRIPDAQTGFRAFSRRIADTLLPRITRYRSYDFEAVFLLDALRAGFRVTSVEVPTIYGGSPSHFRHWADGWKVARVFARYFRGAA